MFPQTSQQTIVKKKKKKKKNNTNLWAANNWKIQIIWLVFHRQDIFYCIAKKHSKESSHKTET